MSDGDTSIFEATREVLETYCVGSCCCCFCSCTESSAQKTDIRKPFRSETNVFLFFLLIFCCQPGGRRRCGPYAKECWELSCRLFAPFGTQQSGNSRNGIPLTHPYFPAPLSPALWIARSNLACKEIESFNVFMQNKHLCLFHIYFDKWGWKIRFLFSPEPRFDTKL